MRQLVENDCHFHRKGLLLWSVAVGTALLTVSPSTAKAGRADVAMELREAVALEHSLRAERRALAETHAAALRQLDTEIQEAEDELEEHKGRAHQLAAKKDAKPEDEDETETEERTTPWTVLAELRDEAVPIAHRIRRDIASGVPYQRDERLAKADTIVKRLTSEKRTDQVEALADLWTLLSAELRLGQSTELYNEPVDLGGDRRVNAYLVRVGRVLLAFASEDGDEVGVYAGERWKLDLSPAERASIIRSTEILRRRVPPTLQTVPFWYTPAAGKEER